jgi:acyl-CoA synthetase (AMP-forming)/AMP-acid ligase II
VKSNNINNLKMMKQLLRRAFSSTSAAVHPKFPEGTVAGLYKAAVSQNHHYDAVRFGAQKFNWTLREFDKYSSAFAYGLVENGFSSGDKLLVWTDQTNSAELLVAQVGAIKAGVTIVAFDEKDNQDALNQALKTSGARGLLFSPQTVIS